jgi:hypothetical protein
MSILNLDKLLILFYVYTSGRGTIGTNLVKLVDQLDRTHLFD